MPTFLLIRHFYEQVTGRAIQRVAKLFENAEADAVGRLFHQLVDRRIRNTRLFRQPVQSALAKMLAELEANHGGVHTMIISDCLYLNKLYIHKLLYKEL